jgi:hypothetical protein
MKVFNSLTLADYKSPDGEVLYPEGSKYKVIRVIAEDQNTVNKDDLLFVIQPVDA